MEFFKNLFYKFNINIAHVFVVKNLLWHLTAIALTFIFVISGFDWGYFLFFAGGTTSRVLFSAALVGFLFPVLIPVLLLVLGKICKNLKLFYTGCALSQVAILSLLVSYFYKFFSGRIAPPLNHLNNAFLDIIKLEHVSGSILDTSRVFYFGFGQNGIFWGWPSSHTTVAFAMAVTLITMYPKNKLLKVLAILYAFYIGIGISMSIHWFSDFVAGAIFGTLVGVVVGKSFLELLKTT